MPALSETRSATRLLLSDVDGTLVTSDKRLTDSAVHAVRKLRDAGILFAIASPSTSSHRSVHSSHRMSLMSVSIANLTGGWRPGREGGRTAYSAAPRG
ncbi:HAD family hydrolase [Leucobacter sp. HY1910]